jgi:outer membrane receptor protein involved in Fe transport
MRSVARWRGRRHATAVSALTLALTMAALVTASASPRALRGLTLGEALRELERRGLVVVFSSALVRDAMRVGSEPAGTDPRQILGELLEPHNLHALEVTGGRLVVVPGRLPALRTRTPSPQPAAVRVPAFREEILVTSEEQRQASAETIASRSLERAKAGVLPHQGDDLLRAVELVPGSTMHEGTSRVQLHGSRDDEVLVLLDDLELLAPYHLQDFDSALSIVTPGALEHVQLTPDGYSAEYGDRMGGVLELTTATPSRERQFVLGLSVLALDATASGTWADGRGGWFGSARGGSYHLALEVDGREGDPRFWDVFGKTNYAWNSRNTWRGNLLIAHDDFVLSSPKGGEDYANRWRNSYAWVAHDGLLRPQLLVETLISAGEIRRRRSGSAAEPETSFEVRDSRSLDLAGIKQVWRYDHASGFDLEAGIDLRQLGTTIDYRNERRLLGALGTLRTLPASGASTFRGRQDFQQSGFFLSAHLRPLPKLSAEVGLRRDRSSLDEESYLSPRLSLAWRPFARGVVRAAWGRYFQSQRPNELQIEDEQTELQSADNSEHRALDLEYLLASGPTIRIGGFERRLSRSGPRFENLFDSASVFPELALDRVRVEPHGGEAKGVELEIRGRRETPLAWWLAYALAYEEEYLDSRQVPSPSEQRHTLRAGLGYRFRNHLAVNATWLLHSGWPTTAVAAEISELPDGTRTALPVLGPRNGERLPTYHRLDVRASRSWTLSRGELSAYLDLQNLYDRDNVRGFRNFEFRIDDQGATVVESEAVNWGDFLPSFGIRWEF